MTTTFSVAKEKNKKILYRFVCAFLAVLIVSLTLAPIAYAHNGRTVKIGYYITEGFQEYNPSSHEYSGYSYEYLQALSQYTDWKMEYVHVSFNDGLKMLENGELDLMNNVSKTEDREKKLDFSEYSSGSNYACLALEKGNTAFAYEDFKSYDKLVVGLVKESIFNEPFLELCKSKGCSPKIKYYDTKDDAIKAQQNKEIDARIITSSQNVDVQIIAMFSPSEYFFATTKGNDELISQLNDAMMHINIDLPNLDEHLQSKYYSMSSKNQLVLTNEEKEYVKENSVVTVACTSTWYPISYFDNNEYSGPISEMFKMMSENTGLIFDFKEYDSYSDAINAFSKGETDMICEIPYDFEYAGKYNADVTAPIIPISIYRVTDPDNGSSTDGRRPTVAILKDTYIGKLTKERYSNNRANYIECTSAKECVDTVLSGDADCTYINTYQSADFQSQGKYLPLQYYLMPEMQYEISMAVAESRSNTLDSIIAKGINSISDSEMNDLFRKCVDQTSKSNISMIIYQHPTIAVIIVALVVALFTIFIFFHFYSKRINRKNEELVKAKAAESSFLSRMSHDIRTPLNGIIGMTELANVEPDGSPQIKTYLKNIDSSGKYLLDLVNNILDMSKIESGALELKAEPYELGEFIDYINAVINPICVAKDIKFSIDMPYDNITVITDKVRLNQIFVNLLSNSVKYTHCEGNVKLYSTNVKKENSVLSLDIVVEDNGIGMSKEFQEHMFDAFSQEEQKTAASGTGLGLSIVKQLIDMMGGRISVQSEKNSGTKIIVHMNMAIVDDEKVYTKKQNVTNDFAILKGKNIMICEDNDLNAEIASRMLKKQGANTFIVINGEEGVQAFKDSEMFSIDAILMDVRMPVMDGLEATKRIRNLQRNDAKIVPIIAMTADAYDEDIERTKQSGMDAHLSKPVDMMRMYQVISRCIGERHK